MSIPHESFWGNEVFSKFEKKEINLDSFLKNLDIGNEILKKAQLLEKQDRKSEKNELSIYEQFFDGKLDIWDSQTQFTSLSNTKNNYEISWEVDSLSEKEKIKIYSILSNLAYSEFRTINGEWKERQTQGLEIKTVKLDPLSFPNIDKIFNIPKPKNLTEEEEILLAYITENNNKNINNNNSLLASDIEDILRFSKFNNWETKIAELDEKHRNTSSDVIPNNYLELALKKQNQTRLITNWLEHLRQEKIQENWNILEQLDWNFEVIDYFPRETDKTKSWFWAICLKDTDWNMYFAIRWTEITDWWDIKTGIWLVFNKVPEKQTKDMIDFVERNIKGLKKWEKFRVIWHSLGWTLTQILTSMYPNKVDESYTFNSPWAKDLETSIDKTDRYFAKFDSFRYNKSSKDTWELITNVSWTAWYNLISDLWEDIWEYEIKLEWLSSHSIIELVKYVENLSEDSNELEKKKVEKEIKFKDKKKKR